MTAIGVEVLERISIVTPLGVRFRDEATRAFVTDGLIVTVHPAGAPERRTYGISNRGSVFVFRNLPGMRHIENGSGDAAFWTTHPPQFEFILSVRDTARRYLPFTLPVLLPQRRVLGIALTSPLMSPLAMQTGSEEGFLPLFPAPSYAPPDAMAVLRAEIVHPRMSDDSPLRVIEEPAAWALVEAKAGEQRLVTGMADERGRVMLPLFYPKPVVSLGSPATVNTPLTQQTWAVDFTVRYRRRVPAPEIPDLVDVLTQPVANVWRDTAQTTAWSSATLRFGRELVLASETSGGVPGPTLHITPAVSPP